LDPPDGRFGVFAWVQGGEPGQVIISQTGTADWLLADASAGKLMTELGSGRYYQFTSNAAITDGGWHWVRLTWDGYSRILYVDDTQVGRDTRSSPVSSKLGLYTGCGKNTALGSFFSGLVDDIRIYNVALSVKEIEELVR